VMHALTNVPLPAYDEKTEAVLLYSETNVTVISTDKIRTQGARWSIRFYGPTPVSEATFAVISIRREKIKSLHGWCIPAQGKDYESRTKMQLRWPPIPQAVELISTKNSR